MTSGSEMHATAPGDEASRTQKRRVLGTLSVIVLLLAVGVPAALYSLAPVGPVGEGALVYANGRHEVALADGGRCFLEPREPLRVVQMPSDRPDHRFVARIAGRATLERPFCPPDGRVLLGSHQFVVRLSLWEDLQALVR